MEEKIEAPRERPMVPAIEDLSSGYKRSDKPNNSDSTDRHVVADAEADYRPMINPSLSTGAAPTVTASTNIPFQNELQQVERLRDMLRSKRIKATERIELHRELSAGRSFASSRSNTVDSQNQSSSQQLTTAPSAVPADSSSSDIVSCSESSSDSSSSSADSSSDSDSSSEAWDIISGIHSGFVQSLPQPLGASMLRNITETQQSERVEKASIKPKMERAPGASRENSFLDQLTVNQTQKVPRTPLEQNESYSSLIGHPKENRSAEYQGSRSEGKLKIDPPPGQKLLRQPDSDPLMSRIQSARSLFRDKATKDQSLRQSKLRTMFANEPQDPQISVQDESEAGTRSSSRNTSSIDPITKIQEPPTVASSTEIAKDLTQAATDVLRIRDDLSKVQIKDLVEEISGLGGHADHLPQQQAIGSIATNQILEGTMDEETTTGASQVSSDDSGDDIGSSRSIDFNGNFDELYAMAMECSDSDYSDSDYTEDTSSFEDLESCQDDDKATPIESVRDMSTTSMKSQLASPQSPKAALNPLAGALNTLHATGGGGLKGFTLSNQHVSLFEKAAAGLTISIFNQATQKFVISNGDVDSREIVAKMNLPKFEISRVDHAAPVPGSAFSVGYIQKKVPVRKIAMELIKVSFEKFHYRKSFWTIVPKIPPKTKSVLFADSERRIFRQDRSEGDTNRKRRSMDMTSSNDIEEGSEGEEDEGDEFEGEEAAQSHFFVKRVTENVVLVRSKEDESYVKFYDQFSIPDLRLPPGYDLLINPFFFIGEGFEDEVARDTVCGVCRDGEDYASTLTPATARGFILCFGQAWQDLVVRVTDRCKRGEELGMPWPKFLETINSLNGPAPDYFDIPRGYWIYASSLLLGIYKQEVGVREIWAAGGLVGMYSFARRQNSSRGDYNRDIAIVFAMLREATYGCRSQKLGVRLLHYLPAVYHDDYVAFCTLPWSTAHLESKKMATSYMRKEDKSITSSRRPFRRFSSYHVEDNPETFCSTMRTGVWGFLRRRILKPIKDMYKNAVKESRANNKIEIELRSTRFLVTIDDPKHRGLMNFLGAIGLEMIGIAYPTVIENYMNVISDSFSDAEDAKEELRYFSNKERMLPGAVLRAANFAEANGGVLNIIQEGASPESGHVEWMRKYSFLDSMSTLVMLGFATVLGWIFETGAFHFMMAITVLTRIYEEVSVFGTFYVLVWGRQYGHFMYEDSIAQFLVPALLGSVEATFELVPPTRIRIAQYVLLIQGGLAGAIIFLTMVARLQFKDNDGRTYDEVLERDGSIECLLSGENETGYRSIDHPNGPGVGPLQAQLFNLCESNGGSDVASSTAAAPYHVSGQWMIAGTLQRNHDLDFGLGSPAAAEVAAGTARFGEGSGKLDHSPSWLRDDEEDSLEMERETPGPPSVMSASTVGYGDVSIV